MTKEENAFRQRVWQFKRKLKSTLAFSKIMKRITGSEKGFRLIKTALRRVTRDPNSTPQQVLRASEWLMYLETGAKRAPTPKELMPVTAEEIDFNSPILNPEINPDPTDPEIAEMLKKVRGQANAA